MGVTVLVATHDLSLVARYNHRLLSLHEGRLVGDLWEEGEYADDDNAEPEGPETAAVAADPTVSTTDEVKLAAAETVTAVS